MNRLTDDALRVLNNSPLGRWYAQKEPVEQRIILWLGFVICLAILWVGVWKPVSDWRDMSLNQQHNTQALFDWLRSNEAAARQAAESTNRGNASRRSITPVVTKAAAAHQITVNRLQPEANGIVSVSVQKQPFNKIVAWVVQLEENNGVSVVRANIDGIEVPGFVNAQLRLN